MRQELAGTIRHRQAAIVQAQCSAQPLPAIRDKQSPRVTRRWDPGDLQEAPTRPGH